MNWKKYKLLISGGVVCLLLAIVSVVFLIRFKGEASDASDRLDRAVRQVQALKQADVFPSAANAATLAQQEEKLAAKLAELRSALSSGQVNPQPIDASRFGIHVTEFRNRLMDPEKVEILATDTATDSGVESGVREFLPGGPAPLEVPEPAPETDESHKTKVPGDFGFGFEAYIVRGRRPNQQEIPRITVQMQLVEKVCNALYEAGVEELRGVYREQFEETEADLRRRNLARAISAERSGLPPEEEMEVKPAPHAHLYRTETLRVRFNTREPELWKALNLLAAHTDTLVVSAVTLKNLNPNPALQPKLESETPSGRSGRPGRRTRRSAPSSPGGGNESEEVLPGKELIQATLDIEAVLFTDPEAVASETDSPEGEG